MSERYFEEDIPERPEIVAGVFRESQIVTLAGPFNVGKTPLLAHLGAQVSRGLPWCGRETVQRPVAHFDFESSDPAFRTNYLNICGGQPPEVPEQLEPYVLNGDYTDPRTKLLLSSGTVPEMMKLAINILERKPTSLLIFDPVELAFPIDVLKKGDVLRLYKGFRKLLSQFPHAAILSTHNLRKTDRKVELPDLASDPHGWLQEIAGSLDIVNRSDVRIGVTRYREGVMVVNGVRRNEDMHPLLLAPIDDNPDKLAGFRPISTGMPDLIRIFSPEQLSYWTRLPSAFSFSDHANNGIPKGSLSRLVHRAISLGVMLREPDGRLIKVPAILPVRS